VEWAAERTAEWAAARTAEWAAVADRAADNAVAAACAAADLEGKAVVAAVEKVAVEPVTVAARVAVAVEKVAVVAEPLAVEKVVEPAEKVVEAVRLH